MTSRQRLFTALRHQEPDRVPWFLLLTMHGARKFDMSIRDYFARPECVAEAQLYFQKRYHHDCLNMFFFAALEFEAWGGDVLYYDNSPPNAGAPLLSAPEAILRLQPPRIAESFGLHRVLKAIELVQAENVDEIPVLGVVISPFSLPVMQLGFELYIQVLFEHPQLFEHLMRINEAFCIEWANAQFAAGATAICYFDPVSSPSIIPCSDFLGKGAAVARRVRDAVDGPMAIHLASGRSKGILQPLVNLGFAAVGVGADEDLGSLKASTAGRIALLGNLNGIAMRHWTPSQAQAAVKSCIGKAGKGGGFVLSDSHGEIPWQVSDETLLAMSDAVRRWGTYPLECA